MKITRNVFLLVCFLLLSNLAFSQQEIDTASLSPRFIFPHFTDGTVSFKDGNVVNVKLNYDTFTDQMQFLANDNSMLQIAEPEKVIKVVISNRTFIYYQDSFIEEIINGPVSLYARLHQERIAEKVGAYGGASPAGSIQSYSSYSGDGNVTKLSSAEAVSYKSDYTFFVSSKGKIRIVAIQKDLLKCFSSNKDLIQQEMVKEKTKFNSIESAKKIIEWINANGIKD
ncbi:MAG: hypothetical protein Q8908_03000 [Bacteroidota bacterium]|nr:hypothetical protein [Bacteroidota bacterium]